MYRPISTLMLLLTLLFTAACGSRSEKQPAAPKGESNYMMGLSYLRQQQLTAALKEFMAAVEADPQNADFQNALAQTYQFKQAYPQAEEHYLKAIALSNGNPQYQNNLAALVITSYSIHYTKLYDCGRPKPLAVGAVRPADEGAGERFERPTRALRAGAGGEVRAGGLESRTSSRHSYNFV